MGREVPGGRAVLAGGRSLSCWELEGPRRWEGRRWGPTRETAERVPGIG